MLTIIERDIIRKPQLGGWRNKITGVKYLNAESQTGPPPKRIPWERTCSRKTQTAKVEDKESQSTYEHATQMWRRDCYIASCLDKYVSVKPYETYEEMQIRLDVNGKARIIQRCYRAYRFIKFVKESVRLYRKMLEDCKRHAEEKVLFRKEHLESECRILNSPRSLMDLDARLSHLEKIELAQSDIQAESSPRTRGLKLLQQKCQMHVAAEAKITNARAVAAQKLRARFLATHCRPRRWRDRKGRVVEMLSLRNQAARECWDLYERLDDGEAAKDDGVRMEILLKARSVVDNHDCKPVSIFRRLVDQEIIMISKSVEQTKFLFLRKRIIGAYLNFLKTSHNCTCKSVNENGDITIHDYEFREPLEKNRLFCISCCRLLSRCKFPVTARTAKITKCKGCVRLHTLVQGHVDYRPYVHLLSIIREYELSRGYDNCVANVMSAWDLHHLVQEIWHGRSVLSELTDPIELRLPRYKIDEPWSPWNCLLLTDDEAEAHYCVGGGDKHYSPHLRRKIKSAHRTARMSFRGLLAFEGRIDLEKIDDRQPVAVRDTITTTTTTTTTQSPTDVACDNRSEDLIGRIAL